MENDETLNASGDADNHEPHFEPIITLPEVKVPTMEEDEVIMIQLRAKLFRLDTTEKDWKERGTGEVKLLHNEKKGTVRVVMRRDKTLKLCANHYVTPIMELKPNCGSDRAWVWTTLADFSDDNPHAEILAIKFINSETAMKWKEMFETAKHIVCSKGMSSDEEEEDEEEENDEDEEKENKEEEEEETGSKTGKKDVEKDNNDGEEESKIVKDIEKLKIDVKSKSEEKKNNGTVVDDDADTKNKQTVVES